MQKTWVVLAGSIRVARWLDLRQGRSVFWRAVNILQKKKFLKNDSGTRSRATLRVRNCRRA